MSGLIVQVHGVKSAKNKHRPKANLGKRVLLEKHQSAQPRHMLRSTSPIARPLKTNQGAKPMSDDRLIVAMDVPNVLDGLELAKTLGDSVNFYKIGLGMLTGGGLALANELMQEHGKRIFLDMKFFDIGATVEAAVRGVAQFDLDFLTVHGDPHVVRAAREGAGGSDMKILAVTILTSLDRDDLDASCIKAGNVADLVQERAGIALSNGADGVIASLQEAALIRALPEAQGKLIVTPGVRPEGAALGDQKRVMTPAQAIANGADHVVVGRPIWQASNPKAAAQGILAELASAQTKTPNH
jgi:orotidine-5'-phosphate decarboxylase